MNAISPLGTIILGLFLEKDALVGEDGKALGAILVFTLLSNYEGREVVMHKGSTSDTTNDDSKTKFHLFGGLYNLVLVGMMSCISFWISHYLRAGPGAFLSFEKEDFTNGGRGLWNVMVGAELSSFMIVMTFSFFYLDEGRKRVRSFDSLQILTPVHSPPAKAMFLILNHLTRPFQTNFKIVNGSNAECLILHWYSNVGACI